MMIFDNAAYNRETKPSSALLGGKVGQEQLFFHLGRDSMSGVRDHDLHRIARAYDRGDDLNLFHHRVMHGFSGVVDQVGYGAFYRIGISLYPRQVGRERLTNMYTVEPSVEHDQSAL